MQLFLMINYNLCMGTIIAVKVMVKMDLFLAVFCVFSLVWISIRKYIAIYISFCFILSQILC